MKKAYFLIFGLACLLPAQAPSGVTLPTAVAVVGEFNQLATPQWALGLSALYTTTAQSGIGMYNTTTADIVPVKAKDPTTGKPFYAVSAQLRQGIHEKILATGNFRALLGADIGPGFSSSPSGGISISATASFVATGIYHLNSVFSVVVPLRMLYVSGIGWNPVLQAGISINLAKLPPAK